MRFIFIVLFLISFGSVSMGGVGDIYFCEPTTYVITENHEARTYTLEKFKFKWEQSQIKFGSGSYFDDASYNIEFERDEMFQARRKFSFLMFWEGDFYYSLTTYGQSTSISAKCDKF